MLRGQFFWDVFIAPEERAGSRRSASRPVRPDFPAAEYENAFANARGEHRVIAWRSAPVLDPDGRRREHRRRWDRHHRALSREQELERERDATTTVLQTIPSLITVLESKRHHRRPRHRNPIAAVNRAFRETLGWRDEQLVGGRSSISSIPPICDAARAASRSPPRAVRRTSSNRRGAARRRIVVAVAWRAAPVTDVTGRTPGLILVTGHGRDRAKAAGGGGPRLARRASSRPGTRRGGGSSATSTTARSSGSSRSPLSLRLAEAKLDTDPAAAAEILEGARDELAQALEELRELARGIHPAVLTDRGLGAALEALAGARPFPVELEVHDRALAPRGRGGRLLRRRGGADERRQVRRRRRRSASGSAQSDGTGRGRRWPTTASGGADPAAAPGLRGLADRVAALDGTLVVESPRGGGTRVRARSRCAAAAAAIIDSRP